MLEDIKWAGRQPCLKILDGQTGKNKESINTFIRFVWLNFGTLHTSYLAFQNLYGVNGLNFAVVDDNITVQAAMAGRAQSVLPGKERPYSAVTSLIEILNPNRCCNL